VIAMANTPSLNASIRVVRNAGALAMPLGLSFFRF
jgi:hypothetical protein